MKSKLLMAVLLAVGLGLGSGCVALVAGGAAAGVGAVFYHNGELRTDEAVGYDQAWDAILAATKELHYAVVEQNKDPLTAKLTARAPGDKKIEIGLDKVSGTVSRIKIRVGTFGDKTYSQAILDTIKRHF